MIRKSIFIFVLMVIVINLHCETAPKIGLALSGGGARGLAHIGVLKVIDEIGLDIDYVAGTSIGAIIGALYAVGYTALEIEEMLLNNFEWDFSQLDLISRQNYYIGEKRWANYNNLSFLLSDTFTLSLPQGFISGNRFLNLFFKYTYNYTHVTDFNELPISFACVATDLLTGETIVLQDGHLHEAMRASMSVPSLFSPFEMKGRLLIDGGIKMNLPSPLLREMGADYVLGVQVFSELRNIERLTNPIVVLDQTINIGSLERNLQAINDCSYVIVPVLNDLRSTDFNRASEMIAAGEKAARKALPELLNLRKEQEVKGRQEIQILPGRIILDNISVKGNKHLSSSKVREYTGLTTGIPLSKYDIISGTEKAYNSKLFQEIYPVIEQTNEGYDLILRVTERPRNKLGFNIRYNDRDDLILSSVIEMRNYLANNSNFFLGISVGGRREILVDYVKNFGKEWGVYFRVFPYINEHTLYLYEDLDKIASSNSLEYGSVFGIGSYVFNLIIIESYLFTYQKVLYRDIADITERDFFSSGIGLKFYHETLDNFLLPMTGSQLMMKYSYADENFLSDFTYNKFYGRFQYLFPLAKFSSLRLQFEYGSFFDEEAVEFDPFYVGGFDNFLGLRPYEKSAPVVKIFSLANRFRLGDNFFVDLQFNMANTGKYDLWQIDEATIFGGGLKVGYKSLVGPVRGGMGFDRQGNINTYISVGYDFDTFEFSRR